MMQRVPRYPPAHARMIRVEEGPPMYRMLGYADRSNLHWDLTEPTPPGYEGPFAIARAPHEQSVGAGPGRFGLPSQPLAYTTAYWDDKLFSCDPGLARRPHLRIHHNNVLPTRPEAEVFPEMAVPGSGMVSKFRDSGYMFSQWLDQPWRTTCTNCEG
ncbi:hypothetical protein PoB_002751600 [Plakobranchus ocellatus]|uniref:Uncharacterized protein n=1 Tax=Plakobranchus ocellatus TaxID=259542 RepID=A0AAV3ZYL6_9GAST|nr:hypothetical protein PoB_002751600 [Plakobranchus ocellatus]